MSCFHNQHRFFHRVCGYIKSEQKQSTKARSVQATPPIQL
jgi:hypothetical protein